MGKAQTWPYWGIFGLCCATGLMMGFVVWWRLQAAFEQGELTRETLTGALIIAMCSLTMLVLAGWAFANRPRAQPVAPAPQWSWN